MTQPPLKPENLGGDMPPPPQPPARRRGWDLFFSTENPMWTLFPIVLSLLALWFAYKSNVINREWADAHLRITVQAFMGYYQGDDFFVEDGDFYFPCVMGSMEGMQDAMNRLVLANNDMGMRWLSESVGLDAGTTVEDMPYSQHFIFLAICNDGDQIAEDLYVSFNHYKVDDPGQLRGKEAIPEGVEPVEWMYGPSIIPPDMWIVIPLGSCYIRFDPQSQEPDIRYFGDFYEPVDVRYSSAVSGAHSIPLVLEDLPVVSNAFIKPPIPEEDTSGLQGSTDEPPQVTDESKDDRRSRL